MFRRGQNFTLGLRFTAALLLAVIAWGSTGEVAHGHAAAETKLDAQTASYAATGTAKVTTASVNPGQPARSSSRPNTSSECLICQLHHNLSTTLLAEPAGFDGMLSQPTGALAPTPVHFLEFTTAQPGRAPPVSFLS